MTAPALPAELLALLALSIATLAAAVGSHLRSRPSALRARLEAIANPLRRDAPVTLIAEDAPKKLWERLLIVLGRTQGDGEARTSAGDTLRARLRYAGFRGPSAVHIVLGIRLILACGLPVLAAPLFLAEVGHRRPLAGAALLGALAALGFMLPAFMAGRLAVERQRRIGAALPDVVDLLVLCVEAGLGLQAAIARVAEARATPRDPLGKELAHLAAELRVGVPRRQALHNLVERTGSEDVRALVAHLNQTERLGGSVAPALRAQSQAARAMRKLRAEEIANRLPVKMLLPTALFMPALFLVIFVPVVLQASEALSGGRLP
jgi:tight adherence protein C